jgi:hypothetical protein
MPQQSNASPNITLREATRSNSSEHYDKPFFFFFYKQGGLKTCS